MSATAHTEGTAVGQPMVSIKLRYGSTEQEVLVPTGATERTVLDNPVLREIVGLTDLKNTLVLVDGAKVHNFQLRAGSEVEIIKQAGDKA
ncbi:MAG: hypothetical protein AAB421_05425 [Patescibacteria group bacterium]